MKLATLIVFLGVSSTIAQTTPSEVGQPTGGSGNSTAAAARVQALAVPTYKQGDPTNYEQFMLELINRARANPNAEAARLGISLNQGLPAGSITSAPKQPLAFEQSLITAARGHSQWMLDNDIFNHTGANGTDGFARMTAAGYPFTGSWKWGENIVWKGYTTPAFAATTQTLHDNLVLSVSHRKTIMDNSFRQIGVGIIDGTFPYNGVSWKALMGTQNYALSGGSPVPAGPLLLGVVFKDTNSNQFYDPGEGLGGVNVSVQGSSTTTSASGGYAIPLGTTSGSLIVTFSGSALTQSKQVPVQALAGVNTKVDLIANGTPGPTPTPTPTPSPTPVPSVAAPTINPNGAEFAKTVKVTMATSTSGATVRYTVNGSEPTASSTIYKSAITLKKTTTVKAKAFKVGATTSPTSTAVFTKTATGRRR